MAPKKAAKKVAKKAAKKAPGQRRMHDLRRCYEHLGRVSTLLPALSEPENVIKLASLAKELLQTGQSKDAAEVMRAAEHLCFGLLSMHTQEEPVSEQLLASMHEEYAHLVERAQHRGAEAPAGAIGRLFATIQRQARQAFKAGHLRASLELARGAEALSQVTAEFQGRLRGGELPQLETV